MKRYKITGFEKKIEPQNLVNNTLNVLLGASLAMKHSLFHFKTIFRGDYNILFETNNEVFVSALRAELSNYNLSISESHGG